MREPSFGDFGGGILLYAVILLIIFLVAREFFCWYWKINRLVALLTEVRDLLAGQRGSADLAAIPLQTSQQVVQPNSREYFCAICSEHFSSRPRASDHVRLVHHRIGADIEKNIIEKDASSAAS
jgi:hypothetical protein